MRRLRGIYPEYAVEVEFYAVGAHYGISEDIETLLEDSRKRDYPWKVAAASPQILVDLGITIQSTKIAFDSEGTIVYRGDMGQGTDEQLRLVFTELAAIGGE